MEKAWDILNLIFLIVGIILILVTLPKNIIIGKKNKKWLRYAGAAVLLLGILIFLLNGNTL